MLYDPKWEVETKADPFKLETLIAWLEKQPGDKQYDYCEPRTCLIAQYLKAQGVEQFELLSTDLKRLGWLEIVNPRLSEPTFTFGGALERARKLVRA